MAAKASLCTRHSIGGGRARLDVGPLSRDVSVSRGTPVHSASTLLRPRSKGCRTQLCPSARLSLKFFSLCKPTTLLPSCSWASESRRPSHQLEHSGRRFQTHAFARILEQASEDHTVEEDFIFDDEDDYKLPETSLSLPSTESDAHKNPSQRGPSFLGLAALAAAFFAVSLVPLPASAAAVKVEPSRTVSSAPQARSGQRNQERRHKKVTLERQSAPTSSEQRAVDSEDSEDSRLNLDYTAPTKEECDIAIRARVPYSWFLDAVDAGRVQAVWIMSPWAFARLDEHTVEYKTTDPSWLDKLITKDLGLERKPLNLVTVRLPDGPGDTVTMKALRRAGVRLEVVHQQTSWQEQAMHAVWYAIPLMLLFTMLGGSEVGGLAAMMNKKAKLFEGGKSDTNFEHVAGCDEAKEELVEVVEFLKQSEKYRALGARVPKGVLLCGPAGTGKTLLAKAVAGEADVPFFSISASEFLEIYGGMGASRVRKTFAECRKNAPCILFIDELDAIGRSRSVGQVGGYDQEREQTLNQILTEMDGFDSTKDKPVIILGATNRPEILDTALVRPGRFDRTVTVDRPDKKGREAILRLHMKEIKIDKDLDVSAIAGSTIGFTGADLANLVNEAALLAARKDLEQVGREQLMEAAERSRAGLERKSLKVSDVERRTVAFHECGHALVGCMSPEVVRSTVTKISIVPRGSGALGYTLNEPQEDRYLQGEDDIRSFITVALAGRAAERLVFGRLTSGASDDLQRATESAERMVTMFGMSAKVGPRALRTLRQSYMEEQGYATSSRQAGQELQQVVDDEINGILQAADDWCQRILVRNRDLLDEMAEKLLIEEVLQESQLADFLKRADPPEGLEHWFKTGKLPEDFGSDSIYRKVPELAIPR